MTTVPEELSRTPEFQDKRNGQSFSYGDYRPKGSFQCSRPPADFGSCPL
jgi:hypothetical protein